MVKMRHKEMRDIEGNVLSCTYCASVNIHKAGRDSSQVDKWSAGCQVFKNEGDFNEFMTTIRTGAARFGNKFTYTLLERADLEKKTDES